MKTSIKKLTIVALVFAGTCTNASAQITGSIGTHINWSINTEDSTLTITGDNTPQAHLVGGSYWSDYGNIVKYITTIGMKKFGNIFQGLTILDSVYINSDLQYNSPFYQYTFLNCDSLRTVKIDVPAYYNTSAFTFFGSGIIYMNALPALYSERGMFAFCPRLTRVEFIHLSARERIYGSAFQDCYSLKSMSDVGVENGVTKRLYGAAFANCTGLTGELKLPNSINVIHDLAFLGCHNITSVILPDSINLRIFKGAFMDCNLSYIFIPDSVTRIGEAAGYSQEPPDTQLYSPFIGNTALTEIEVGENNPNYMSYNGVLYSKDTTILVSYPAGNARTEYTIPASVDSIASGAFGYCNNLKRLWVEWQNPLPLIGFHWNEYIFDYDIFYKANPANITLVVPDGTKEAYMAAEVWKDFNIMEVWEVAMATDNPEMETMIFYPNPAKEFIQISSAFTDKPYKIYTTDGKIVQSGTTSFTVNIRNLKSGLYMIEIDGNKRKLVVE